MDLYVSHGESRRVRRIDLSNPTPTIENVVGSGAACSDFWAPCGEAGPAVDAQFDQPDAMAMDSSGLLYVADSNLGRIFRVDLTLPVPLFERFAGRVDPDPSVCDSCAEPCGDGGQAINACIAPRGVVMLSGDNLLLADRNRYRLRRVNIGSGVITGFAGDGVNSIFGDGGLATVASLQYPAGLAIDAAGDILVVNEAGGVPNRIRKIDTATGVITSIQGLDPPADGDFSVAQLAEPIAAAMLTTSSALIVDGSNQRLRLLDFGASLQQTILGYPDYELDSQPPTAEARYSRLAYRPAGIAFLANMNAVLFSEADGNTIRRLGIPNVSDTSTWTVTTLAGLLPEDICVAAGEPASTECAPDSASYVDAVGTNARFNRPMGIAYDSDRLLLFVADSNNHLIRQLELATTTVSTVAGVPNARGFYGEGIPPLQAVFNDPQAVALGPSNLHPLGSLYVADTGNHRVRRIDFGSDLSDPADDMISTVVGDGVASSSGVGEPAIFFPVDSPAGLSVDSYGNLFVSSRNTIRSVAAGADGVAEGSDWVDTVYGNPPRADYPQSVTRCLSGTFFLQAEDTLLVTDACLGMVVELRRREL